MIPYRHSIRFRRLRHLRLFDRGDQRNTHENQMERNAPIYRSPRRGNGVQSDVLPVELVPSGRKRRTAGLARTVRSGNEQLRRMIHLENGRLPGSYPQDPRVVPRPGCQGYVRGIRVVHVRHPYPKRFRTAGKCLAGNDEQLLCLRLHYRIRNPAEERRAYLLREELRNRPSKKPAVTMAGF